MERRYPHSSLLNFQPWRQLFQYQDLISQWCYEVVHIKYISELTVGKAIENDKIKEVTAERNANLGSAQNEVLSNSGTMSVTFKYLATVTISHIWFNSATCTFSFSISTAAMAQKCREHNRCIEIVTSCTYKGTHLVETTIAGNHQIAIVQMAVSWI